MKKILLIFLGCYLCLIMPSVGEAKITQNGPYISSHYVNKECTMQVSLTKRERQLNRLYISMYTNKGIACEPDRSVCNNLKITTDTTVSYFNYYSKGMPGDLPPSVCHGKDVDGWISNEFIIPESKRNVLAVAIGKNPKKITLEIALVEYEAILKTNSLIVGKGAVLGRKILKIDLPPEIVEEWASISNS